MAADAENMNESRDVAQSSSSSTPTGRDSHRRQRLVQIGRIVIAIIVVIGLGLAIRRISADLDNLRQRFSSDILVLESQLANDSASLSPEAKRNIEAAIERLQQQSAGFWKVSLPWLGISYCLQFLGMAFPGLFWRQALVRFGHSTPIVATLSTYFIGHLGRYVPGKAMVFVLRAGGLRRFDVPPATAVVSIFVETLMLMAVGGTLGGLALLSSEPPTWLMIAAVGLVAAASLPTLPPIFRRLVQFIANRKSMSLAPSLAHGLDWKLFFQGWMQCLVGWLLMATALISLMIGMNHWPATASEQALLMSGCLAAATLPIVLGFFSLLPGGIGVRELTLTIVLSPLVGMPAALASAIWMRIISMAAEFSWIGLGYALRRAGTASKPTSKLRVPTTPHA
jgi:uncharacterized membrane protein YbhN (UPF0104 family)